MSCELDQAETLLRLADLNQESLQVARMIEAESVAAVEYRRSFDIDKFANTQQVYYTPPFSVGVPNVHDNAGVSDLAHSTRVSFSSRDVGWAYDVDSAPDPDRYWIY